MRVTYGRICDLAILHGDVEVNPDQYPFAFEVNVGDRQLVCDGHGRGWWKSRKRRDNGRKDQF